MAANVDSPASSARRRILTTAVSSLLTEIGYDHAEKAALETLVEMTQSFITEVATNSKAYCELAGRTEPVLGDVVLGLVNMGFSLEGLQAHSRRPARKILPPLTQHAQPRPASLLQAGDKQPLPNHIPSNFPRLPDPHAYIRTPTHKQPVTEYEAIREKAASHKRDLERALTKFMAKTSETHSLFLVPDTTFPLIACKPKFPPYLDALLPKDQVFEFEEESTETSPRRGKGREADSGAPREDQKSETDPIDNPYLRPVKFPRKKLKVSYGGS